MSWYAEDFTDVREYGCWLVRHSLETVKPIRCDTFEDAQNKISHLNGGDGLTKRERFAKDLMTSAMAASINEQASFPSDYAVDEAIQMADALIAALEAKP